MEQLTKEQFFYVLEGVEADTLKNLAWDYFSIIRDRNEELRETINKLREKSIIHDPAPYLIQLYNTDISKEDLTLIIPLYSRELKKYILLDAAVKEMIINHISLDPPTVEKLAEQPTPSHKMDYLTKLKGYSNWQILEFNPSIGQYSVTLFNNVK